MLRRTFSFLTASVAASALLLGAAASAQELRVLVHGSFSLPKPMLAQFESQSGIKLSIIKGGDAGEMLNKLILTRAQPIADVAFGVDNALVVKAQGADVLEPYAGAAAQRAAVVPLEGPVVAVDYGYVNLNYDKAWFAKKRLALPQSLEDLAQPAYAKLLVVQNPATSSPGNALLLATIGAMGETKAFDWWARMRANGLKVSKGWTEAYYTEFSHNGGAYPLVLSYASSPAAEVFFSKTKLTEPPTGSLALPGAVFRQVEGVGLVRGGKERAAAVRFIGFLRSAAVQQALQTEMWMFPADATVTRVDALRHAVEPTFHHSPGPQAITEHGRDWVTRWTQVVLK